MKTTEILKAIIEAKEKGFTYFGIRGDDRMLGTGEEVGNSYDWDFENDCQSEEKLNGTCATNLGYLWLIGEEDQDDLETIEKATKLHEDNYKYRNTYIIGGKESEYGDDENEIIISGAEVVCKIK